MEAAMSWMMAQIALVQESVKEWLTQEPQVQVERDAKRTSKRNEKSADGTVALVAAASTPAEINYESDAEEQEEKVQYEIQQHPYQVHPSGYQDTLTELQSKALEELKLIVKEKSAHLSQVREHPGGDAFLLRFLRATMKDKKKKRVFQPAAAFKRLESALEFRAKHGLDHTTPSPPSNFDTYLKVRPAYFFQDKKVGTTVMIERFGLLSTYVSKKHLTEEEWIAGVGYMSETIAASLRKFDHEPLGICAVIDAGQLSFLSFAARLSTVKILEGVGATFFPETIGKIMVINAGGAFEKTFSVAKLFMDEETVRKISVHAGIPHQLMRETFEPSKLPQEYGGDNPDLVPVPLDAIPAWEKRNKTTYPL